MNQYKINVHELDENSTTIEQPNDLKINLKPHQLTLLNKCIEFENNRIKLKNYKNITDKYTNLQENKLWDPNLLVEYSTSSVLLVEPSTSRILLVEFD